MLRYREVLVQRVRCLENPTDAQHCVEGDSAAGRTSVKKIPSPQEGTNQKEIN